MNGKIGEYTFELDDQLNRINVYRKGEGMEPEWYIPTVTNLDEKTFHYEIMDWYVKRAEA